MMFDRRLISKTVKTAYGTFYLAILYDKQVKIAPKRIRITHKEAHKNVRTDTLNKV